MTFKEKLIERANRYQKDLDIQKDIRVIKDRLEISYFKRSFCIYLYYTKVRNTLAIGGNERNCYSTFVPECISPAHYRQLFVEALKELGFTDNDIELYEKDTEDFTLYTIKLIW